MLIAGWRGDNARRLRVAGCGLRSGRRQDDGERGLRAPTARSGAVLAGAGRKTRGRFGPVAAQVKREQSCERPPQAQSLRNERQRGGGKTCRGAWR